ncbi:MAG: hypothetical protein K9I74_00200 [Bacteroidales bacterium]|nr:hypothetical protein [Bacteroidales bacterium]
MKPLIQQLQEKQESFDTFIDLTKRILSYAPNVLSAKYTKGVYDLYIAESANNIKRVRPVNRELIIWDISEFEKCASNTKEILNHLYQRQKIEAKYKRNLKNQVNKTLYTIQQMIGIGLDLLGESNSSRKHVGNRFEELIRSIINEIGLANKRIVLKIPYSSSEGTKIYRCENDLIVSPYAKVESTENNIDENELVLSVKTTSKDRMGKMFIDKMLLERFNNHPIKFIGIFLNDVQRKSEESISHTLVSGLFMVYSSFLVELDGVFYIDKPPVTDREPHSKFIKSFTDFIFDDIWKLLQSPS